MGPRSFDRGNTITDGRFQSRMHTSMGPRSFDRGNGEPESLLWFWSPDFNGAAVF